MNFIFIPRYLTSATRQPENGILIRPFEGDPSDTVSALNSSSQNFQHLSAIPSAKEQFEKFPKFGMKEHHWYVGKHGIDSIDIYHLATGFACTKELADLLEFLKAAASTNMDLRKWCCACWRHKLCNKVVVVINPSPTKIHNFWPGLCKSMVVVMRTLAGGVIWCAILRSLAGRKKSSKQ